MASDGDLKDHALNSSHDFYELLGIAVSANGSEIRSAYRKTALKYHPDKVGSNQEALDKFHLLQVAYDVLSDENVRVLYDNARRAREEKRLRESAYSDKRRQMKDELEARERAGVAGLKRKREEASEEEAFQQELKRLAADGARRRKEREEMLRKEMAEAMEQEQPSPEPQQPAAPATVEETDRTIKLRYPAGTTELGQTELTTLFERFGKIEHILLKDKKIKLEGEKHRKEYTIAIVVYQSIVAAHKAVVDFPHLAKQEPTTWGRFEDVNWQSGKEPDCIPKPKRKEGVTESVSDTPLSTPPAKGYAAGDAPSTPAARFKSEQGLKRVPSFGSFKGTPKSATATPSLDAEDAMMIRLKQAAERKRLAEEIKRQEAEQDAVENE